MEAITNQFSYFTILSIISPLFVFVILIPLLKSIRFKSTQNLNLLPGPRKLPFIGNLHNLAFSSYSPHRTLRDLSVQYGPVMHIKLGEIAAVVVSSPEAAKQVMRKHDTVFASRPSFISTEIVTYGGKDIAFSPYNEYWRQIRKICTLELMSAKRVQSFKPLRVTEFSNLCRWIASKADGATPINLTERIGVTIYDIITQASIGNKTNEKELFISVAQKVAQLIGGFTLADLYPSIGFFTKISGLHKIEGAHRELDRLLENIIDEHKLQRSSVKVDRDDANCAEDLLDVLLKFQDDPELPLTNDNIKAVLVDILIAGIETSVTTVDWAMAEMMKQPGVLETAQDEVRRVFNSKGYVDESSFDELSYLKLVVKETFRMHPPVPMVVPRESRENCEIDGYQIPCKTLVIVNAWAIGRHPSYWEDPESFNPERFLKKSFDYKGNDFEYIPFGSGRRICPGMTLGLANVYLPLAMLLYHFDWALPNQMKPEELDMTEHIGMAVRRKNELHVLPTVRRPVPAE